MSVTTVSAALVARGLTFDQYILRAPSASVRAIEAWIDWRPGSTIFGVLFPVETATTDARQVALRDAGFEEDRGPERVCFQHQVREELATPSPAFLAAVAGQVPSPLSLPVRSPWESAREAVQRGGYEMLSSLAWPSPWREWRLNGACRLPSGMRLAVSLEGTEDGASDSAVMLVQGPDDAQTRVLDRFGFSPLSSEDPSQTRTCVCDLRHLLRVSEALLL